METCSILNIQNKCKEILIEWMDEFTSKHVVRSESISKIDWVKQDKISLRVSNKTFQG